MNVLFLVHRVPYPPNRGDRIRTFHVLKFLAERADLHLAFCTEQPVIEDTQVALEKLGRRVTWARMHPQGRFLRAAWSLARGGPATEGLFRSPKLARTIDAWSREVAFDAVVVACSSMVQYLDAPGLNGVPVVVDLIDVDSQKWFDYAAALAGKGGRTNTVRPGNCREGSGRKSAAMVAHDEGRRAGCIPVSAREYRFALENQLAAPRRPQERRLVSSVFPGFLRWRADTGMDPGGPAELTDRLGECPGQRPCLDPHLGPWRVRIARPFMAVLPPQAVEARRLRRVTQARSPIPASSPCHRRLRRRWQGLGAGM